MTPYEAFYGKKPDLSMLRTFGCRAYVHVQKKKRVDAPWHTMRCIYLGFEDGYKGFKCYNTDTNQFVVSRDVVFDENDFPGIPWTADDAPYEPISGGVSLVPPAPPPPPPGSQPPSASPTPPPSRSQSPAPAPSPSVEPPSPGSNDEPPVTPPRRKTRPRKSDVPFPVKEESIDEETVASTFRRVVDQEPVVSPSRRTVDHPPRRRINKGKGRELKQLARDLWSAEPDSDDNAPYVPASPVAVTRRQLPPRNRKPPQEFWKAQPHQRTQTEPHVDEDSSSSHSGGEENEEEEDDDDEEAHCVFHALKIVYGEEAVKH